MNKSYSFSNFSFSSRTATVPKPCLTHRVDPMQVGPPRPRMTAQRRDTDENHFPSRFMCLPSYCGDPSSRSCTIERKPLSDMLCHPVAHFSSFCGRPMVESINGWPGVTPTTRGSARLPNSSPYDAEQTERRGNLFESQLLLCEPEFHGSNLASLLLYSGGPGPK